MTLDTTDPNLSPLAWASTLTPVQLSQQLRRLVADPHCMNGEERRAVLTIAADDLERVS